jgi:hypothetical protein
MHVRFGILGASRLNLHRVHFLRIGIVLFATPGRLPRSDLAPEWRQDCQCSRNEETYAAEESCVCELAIDDEGCGVSDRSKKRANQFFRFVLDKIFDGGKNRDLYPSLSGCH